VGAKREAAGDKHHERCCDPDEPGDGSRWRSCRITSRFLTTIWILLRKDDEVEEITIRGTWELQDISGSDQDLRIAKLVQRSRLETPIANEMQDREIGRAGEERGFRRQDPIRQLAPRGIRVPFSVTRVTRAAPISHVSRILAHPELPLPESLHPYRPPPGSYLSPSHPK
jgi:hypothetical protein